MKRHAWINRRSSLVLVVALAFLISVFSISVDGVNGSAGAAPSQASPDSVTATGGYHPANWRENNGGYVYFASQFRAASARPVQEHLYELPLVLK